MANGRSLIPMVEVFKTNVCDHVNAAILVAKIHDAFRGYSANFDLDDCDKILRIECNSDCIQTTYVIKLLKDFGYAAQVLSDNECYDPLARGNSFHNSSSD
jgi:hypothetical protein